MKQSHIQLAADILKREVGVSFDPSKPLGNESTNAAKKLVGHIKTRGLMTDYRWIALVLQYAANRSLNINHKIKEDAWYGPVTEDAAYRMLGLQHLDWRPDELGTTPKSPRCWTPTDKQMIAAFGQPGSNLVIVTLPYKMRLAWDLSTTVTRATCHKKFAEPLLASLKEVLDVYGYEEIVRLRLDRTGGIYNKRPKRGGTSWSAHAFAVAIDLDPDNNKLRWNKSRASFSKPEYKPMRDAFNRNNLMSLGECYDFDWMHRQLNP